MLRVVFMGTPDFSVPTLSEIIGAGHDVVAVYSQPPRRAGRGMEMKKSPVHEFAESAGIPVLTPTSLRDPQVQSDFQAHQADVAVVIAYGLILPTEILNAPRNGCLNLHASKLPRWRGAAPIQRAIMAGDAETAVMVMQMEEGLDTGPICLAEVVPISANITAGELHDVLAHNGASLMVRALAALERDSLGHTAQSEQDVTYADKIAKAESRLDFSWPAEKVHNHIRGLSPFPGAWFAISKDGKEERVKVLRSELIDNSSQGQASPGEVLDDQLSIACGEGSVRLLELQRAGKRAMQAEEFQRGFQLVPGRSLA
ncbi:MAG: methionyl-tRNA formyltransferase [Pseudomonadota bacterium]